eukprot:scaffold7643_cov126-Cylindrotheca_fusiformis.AAC.2
MVAPKVREQNENDHQQQQQQQKRQVGTSRVSSGTRRNLRQCGAIADRIEKTNADYITAFDTIEKHLEKILEDMISKQEESHCLLRTVKVADKTTGETTDKTTEKTTDHPALLFRLIRLFLAKKRNDMKQLLGVFTGTNGDLRNFRGPDVLPRAPDDSRDMHVSPEF